MCVCVCVYINGTNSPIIKYWPLPMKRWLCTSYMYYRISQEYQVLQFMCTHTHTHHSCSAAAKALENEPKQLGNPKKRKKVRSAQQDSAISSLMDCYAQQRQQSQPGAWKTGLEQEEEAEEVGGVLDEAMCGALGGGDLTKALSTAFKGAMAQAQFEVRERERGRVQVTMGSVVQIFSIFCGWIISNSILQFNF